MEETDIEVLTEGWRFEQLKHTVSAGAEMTVQKMKRFFGMNHNFTRERIRQINDERLKALVDHADTRAELESLIEKLKEWIAAAPAFARSVSADSHSTSVTTDVAVLNKKYLAEAERKLSGLKDEKH